MPRPSKIGAANLSAFGFTGGSSVTATYLVVAGGGAGGTSRGGGGGAGGYQTGTTSLNPTLSYTVLVGAGGTASSTYATKGTNGGNSQLGILTSSIGGGVGASDGATAGNGGSGGGGGTAGTGTPGQGNNGGSGTGTSPAYAAGGGGGAAAAGSNFSGQTAGNGGAGLASSISGTSTYYAGGGGGGTNGSGTAGTGGTGGGGNGSAVLNSGNGTAGTANLGGGGGGGSNWASPYAYGGNGGSGVVIISYVGAQQFGGGVITFVGGNTIHTFNTSGTLVPLNSLTASYLIVGGGGSGGSAGGGAGGFVTGSGAILDTNSTYLVTVGAGGAGSGVGTNGANSSLSVVTTIAVGGGVGGGYVPTTAAGAAGNGGSGGGAGAGGVSNPAGTGTPGQGNNGGSNGYTTGPYFGGGGGGAGATGGNSSSGGAGAGGVGLTSSISGTSKYYAGGGGGGSFYASGAQGAGGNGGGGTGYGLYGTGTAGTANLGGGGGGADSITGGGGGSGGSGIVIISYSGSTQQMAGGTVTISGGNVIHTFTNTGYLTPVQLVNNSLRFRDTATTYLNKTFGTPTNNKIWTYSCWFKKSKGLQDYNILFGAGNPGSGTQSTILRQNAGVLEFLDVVGGGSTYTQLSTSAVYRDIASWYHVVISYDSTQATSSNRAKMYINGSQVTAFSTATYPSQNQNTSWNQSGILHNIGNVNNIDISNPLQWAGYMAEINFVDGQQLTPNSFGTFNAYGIWQPIKYAGSYGNNGFYLPFSNKTSTTTLGYDFSPAGNNWTPNNFSLTAGRTYDWVTDVPTLTINTAANYCTTNSLIRQYSSTDSTGSVQPSETWFDGNLRTQFKHDGVSGTVYGTFVLTSGKWYWEMTDVYEPGDAPVVYQVMTGAVRMSAVVYNGTYSGSAHDNGYMYTSSGSKWITGTYTSFAASYTTGDVIGVALDVDNATIQFFKNGTSQGTLTGLDTSNGMVPAFEGIKQNTGSASWNPSNIPAEVSYNFGQQPWVYTPPAGFLAINTYNL